MTKCAAPVDPNSIVIPKKPANKSASEHRKITKPIMEKRRRARINQSLEQLKQILIEQFHECSKKSNNLEKADILELTVAYLSEITKKQIKQQQLTNANQQQQQTPDIHQNNNNSTSVLNQNLFNRGNLKSLNPQQISKKSVQLIQNGFKDCRQQINDCFVRMQVDKKLNDNVNNHLIAIEKKHFEQKPKFNCDEVLDLSIQDNNQLQANNLILHTPSSACSSVSSSNLFFPQNSSNGGSLSPGSDRSISPSSKNGSVWRLW